MRDSSLPQWPQFRVSAQAAVAASESAWRSPAPASLLAAVEGCGRVLRELPAEMVTASGAPDPADVLAEERATLWLWWGRLLVLADNPQAVQMGVACLDQAIVRLRAALAHGQAEWAQPALVLAWMNRGQGCTRKGGLADLEAAVGCYDQAILLLRDGDGNALGAALMNRAVILLQLSQEQAAVAGLKQAVQVLTPLAKANGAAARNLASAWSNLGVWHLQSGEAAAALAAHREAVQWLRSVAVPHGVAGAQDLAARLINLAQSAEAAGEPEAALRAGREALAFIATWVERDDVPSVELGLRARHGLCVTLGAMWSQQPEAQGRQAWIEEAGDLVEAGLAEYRRLDAVAAGADVAALAARLYGFGAWLYRTIQPQFLSEFLLEHLDDSELRAKVAAEAVVAARQEVVQQGFAQTAGDGLERSSQLLHELIPVEERVRQIYKQLNAEADAV